MSDTFSKPHLLLTNDDGYQADGINILYESLIKLFDVTICAPFKNKSAQSHSVTLDESIKVTPYSKGFIVDGSPVDSVYLGLASLLKDKEVDMVVSGINHGCNLGDDFHYSATVAAAREAAFYKKRSLALSMHHFDKNIASKHADFITQVLWDNFQQFKPGILHSMNFPNALTDNICQSQLGKRARTKLDYEKFKAKRSHSTWYWLGPLEKGQNHDFDIIEDKSISCTSIDYTKSTLGEYTALDLS